MFGMIADDAIKHDLVNPCRRPEIFEFFYHYGEGHTNCLDNVNGTLGKKYPIIRPVKLFIYTKLSQTKRIRYCPSPEIKGRQQDYPPCGKRHAPQLCSLQYFGTFAAAVNARQ